ncbi:TPA: hypothetical protein ACGML9_002053 [Streptococcus agalactiae]
MTKCTSCQKGDWGFPQKVKRQQSNCGISANRLVALFILACVRKRANLAREQAYWTLGKLSSP